jgi:hypothetical protein
VCGRALPLRVSILDPRFRFRSLPPPPPAPAPSTSRGEEAARLLLKSLHDSKENGDEWLSVDEDHEVVYVICVFQRDEMAAESYITVAGMSYESIARGWVRGQLAQRGAGL